MFNINFKINKIFTKHWAINRKNLLFISAFIWGKFCKLNKIKIKFILKLLSELW